MQKSRTGLLCEGALKRGDSNLIYKRSVGPGKEAVLRHRVVPEDLSQIVEWSELRQIDILHGGENVQEARDARGTPLHNAFISRLSLCVPGCPLGEQIGECGMRFFKYVP